jgi:signal transduction histidine kinase
VDVALVLRDAVSDLRPLAEARGGTLAVEVPDALRASVDVDGLLRVVANLVENALKYGPAGQRVTVGAESGPEGLRIRVDDEGPGIPEDERERIFERFARLDRDRNTSVGGTGLGLAVVRETVALSGGRVHVEDAPGGGARFVVLLPQPAEEERAKGDAAAPRLDA